MWRRLFALLLLFVSCMLLTATSAQERPLYMFATNKGMPINDREFLRSYNMHNLNLAALSRYGTVFVKRYS
ncbi:hypothetical protein GCK32_003675 [Trichostrongylus colubriformis]|uniref:Uncharacterized protein n=1 Tax=Trichostrongylus colubriformis TaxID=6319 RepID=A0AAN8GDV6_TRICO